MADLGTAYVSIVPSTEGIGSSIANALDKTADPAGASFGKKLVGKLKGVIGAAALGKVAFDAFKMGAELEQNIGGTKAVFGDFYDDIQSKAQEAYKNMGLSASDYMATANKMGSLFQGSGVSQQKSLKLTTEAMQRAADVASVMGIDTSMAMESIAGAAKGNFTMMDNLGVAMNATTLQAYALEKGVNFNWNTASNAEKAELAMKMFMDRTSQYENNFARESEETLSGSFGAMKSAFQNFLAYLVNGGDVERTATELGQTASAFLFNNLVPAIGRVILNLPQAAIGFISQSVPLILNNIASLLTRFANGDMDAAAKKTIKSFAGGLVKASPQVIAAMGRLVIAIVKAALALPGKLAAAGKTAISSFVKGLKNIHIPKMKITWTTESRSGGGKLIKIPLPKISWNAKGGIFTKPTVFQGVGEAGAEAVVPLEKLWDQMESMAMTIASGSNCDGDINITLEVDGKAIAKTTAKYMNDEINRLSTLGNRRLGLV